MPIHRRTPALILPNDPSPEELLQFWTLSARDRAEVLRRRGDANRRRYAVQLGVHTRFVQKLALTYYTHNCLGDSPDLFCV